MGYGFFDYKAHIPDTYKGMWKTSHIILIVLVYLLAIFLPILLRKAERKKITVFLRVFAVIITVLEISKIVWESYFDITIGDGFNDIGILPIYTCSLFIYTLWIAAWTHGKVQKLALSFITTIGLLYGAIGIIYCNGLNYYPLFSFGGMYSFFFHSSMFLTGMILLVTGYYELEWKDCLYVLIPMSLLALIAVPYDYIRNCDYMLLYSGGGVPLYEDLATWLAGKNLRFLYTILMFITHIPLACIIIGPAKFVKWIAAKVKAKKEHSTEKNNADSPKK